MRDVLRWSPIMTPSPEGTFVSNHEYAMLQEECERLRAALAALEADGGNAVELPDALDVTSEGSHHDYYAEGWNDCRRKVRELAAREASPVKESLTTAQAVAVHEDGWITHNGGQCPVQKDVLIDFKKRNGREYIGAAAYPNGGDWTYTEKCTSGENIVAWRLSATKEAKPS